MMIIKIIIFLAIIYNIYTFLYFRSKKFNGIKKSIEKYTKNCNELNNYIEHLKCSYVDVESFDYGDSELKDNSKYNFKRREWSKDIKTHQTHNCSASVCKNANDKPFKYLTKYFNIKTNEKTLENFENILNNFSAVEQGKILLSSEENEILESVSSSIPTLIRLISKKKLTRKLGFEVIDFSDLYFPIYTFQYVSAGGNSSSKCEIKLNLTNLDKFVKYLNELVKFKKTVIGQRALMTSKLRQKIKERDNHICQICGISTNKEPHLLLEIDHIIPLSKGGITSEDNLQTLCWKCNRSKGSKIQ